MCQRLKAAHVRRAIEPGHAAPCSIGRAALHVAMESAGLCLFEDPFEKSGANRGSVLLRRRQCVGPIDEFDGQFNRINKSIDDAPDPVPGCPFVLPPKSIPIVQKRLSRRWR